MFLHAFPAVLRVSIRTGEALEARVDVNRGGPGNPLSDEELARSRQLPLPDCVGQVGHPLRRLRADRLQGHAARVRALEQADSGAEQHG